MIACAYTIKDQGVVQTVQQWVNVFTRFICVELLLESLPSWYVAHLGYIHIFFQCRHTENFIAQREVIQYLLIKSTLSRTDRFQPGRRAIILCSATEFLATVAAE